MLFLRLLNISLTASCIILAVLLFRLLFRKMPKWITCCLWGIVALRLIMPFTLESELSLIPREPVIPQSITAETVTDVQSNGEIPAQETEPQPTAEPDFKLATSLWFWGMLLLVIYGQVSYVRLRRQVRVSIPHEKNVYLCDQVDSPFILGVFRPRIYVPSGMEESQLAYVLAHENAHLKRKDHWWKPIGYCLLAVYWFNPLIWVAYILLCRDIERACDEKVVAELNAEEKKRYSETLLACSMHRRMVMVCPVAFGEVAVKDRIKGVLNYKKPAFWIVAVSVVACCVLAVCFLTDPKTCKHQYSSEITVASTCTQAGTEQFTCTKCDDSYTKQVGLLEHSYDEGVVTRTSTCTEPGCVSFTCIHCGSVKTQALATNDVHELKETVSKEPTCTHGGEGVLACIHCSYSEARTYPQLSHNFVDYGLVNKDCYEHKRKQICTLCNNVKTVYLNDYGHTWSDGRCTICGAFESGWTPFEWPEAAEWQKKRNEGKLPDLSNLPG